MNGIFTISLDFELHWGGFEKWPLLVTGNYNEYFLRTRNVIPKMLAIFEEHHVHATWAGVGLLFHQSKTALEKNIPDVKPTYHNKKLSAYTYLEEKGIGADEEEDPFHYAHILVKQIIDTENQELGSHTFAHFYCNEPGQTVEQFRADLKAAQNAARAYGVTLKSLVFPRNQFNDSYLKVCFEEGFTSVRSNPVDWFWNIASTQHESYWKRLNRGLDAYFPVGHKNAYPLSEVNVREGFPVCIPASRLLRPYRPKELFLNRMKISRILSEMENAARLGEVYHLWWHPHNFGHYPDESMEGLKQILLGYQRMKKKYGMESCTMAELVDLKFKI